MIPERVFREMEITEGLSAVSNQRHQVWRRTRAELVAAEVEVGERGRRLLGESRGQMREPAIADEVVLEIEERECWKVCERAGQHAHASLLGLGVSELQVRQLSAPRERWRQLLCAGYVELISRKVEVQQVGT